MLRNIIVLKKSYHYISQYVIYQLNRNLFELIRKVNEKGREKDSWEANERKFECRARRGTRETPGNNCGN